MVVYNLILSRKLTNDLVCEQVSLKKEQNAGIVINSNITHQIKYEASKSITSNLLSVRGRVKTLTHYHPYSVRCAFKTGPFEFLNKNINFTRNG